MFLGFVSGWRGDVAMAFASPELATRRDTALTGQWKRALSGGAAPHSQPKGGTTGALQARCGQPMGPECWLRNVSVLSSFLKAPPLLGAPPPGRAGESTCVQAVGLALWVAEALCAGSLPQCWKVCSHTYVHELFTAR